MLKRKIVEITANHLARFGIKECRMDRIATCVRVSKKTIYELFESKQNLLYESICFLIDHYKEQIEQTESRFESPLAAIIAVNNLSLQQFLNCSPSFRNDIKNRSELLKLFEQTYFAAINESYEKQFAKGVQMGLFPQNVNSSLMLTFFEQQIEAVCKESPADALRKIDSYAFNILTLLSGVCTDKGREELDRISPKEFFR